MLFPPVLPSIDAVYFLDPRPVVGQMKLATKNWTTAYRCAYHKVEFQTLMKLGSNMKEGEHRACHCFRSYFIERLRYPTLKDAMQC